MKTILVTGGSGLVGSAIQSIVKDYTYYFIFLNSKKCDLRDYTQTKKVFDEIKPEKIYHLAAKHLSSTNKALMNVGLMNEMRTCHVQITQNILEWQLSNPSCKSLIALSSQMYTPSTRTTIINEQSPCEPQNYYGETKLEAMKLLQFYRRNFHVKTYGAILFNHTSTRSRPDFLFP